MYFIKTFCAVLSLVLLFPFCYGLLVLVVMCLGLGLVSTAGYNMLMPIFLV